MRIRRGWFALGPSLTVALAAASVPWLRAQASDFLGAAIWGGALLASFVGWGAALLQILGLNRAFVGWGIRAALGSRTKARLPGRLTRTVPRR